MNKPELRRHLDGVLAAVPRADLLARSASVARRLAETEAWRRADTVLCFLSMPRELDTARVIGAARASGKAVAVPEIRGTELRFLLMPADAGELPRDRWAIPVPDPAWPELSLARAGRILVAAPGLAFDRRGNRLGRGKGYYDRFLAGARAVSADLVVLGICLAEQLVQDVPCDPHDQPLDGVVTDRETVLVRESRAARAARPAPPAS
jgi:5-formyltetrahydrofolate cyclo-ligase